MSLFSNYYSFFSWGHKVILTVSHYFLLSPRRRNDDTCDSGTAKAPKLFCLLRKKMVTKNSIIEQKKAEKPFFILFSRKQNIPNYQENSWLKNRSRIIRAISSKNSLPKNIKIIIFSLSQRHIIAKLIISFLSHLSFITT